MEDRSGSVVCEFSFRHVEFEDPMGHLDSDAQKAVGNDHNCDESQQQQNLLYRGCLLCFSQCAGALY